MKAELSYQDNFRLAIQLLMSERRLDNLRQAAELLDMKYMALYKVMDGSNNPTTDLCIRLCKEGGFSANWMFLGIGDRYLKAQNTLEQLGKNLQRLNQKIDKLSKK